MRTHREYDECGRYDEEDMSTASYTEGAAVVFNAGEVVGLDTGNLGEVGDVGEGERGGGECLVGCCLAVCELDGDGRAS